MKTYLSIFWIFWILVSLGNLTRPASAQPGAAVCDGFERTRTGNLLQGICYARSGHVHGDVAALQLVDRPGPRPPASSRSPLLAGNLLSRRPPAQARPQ